MIKYTFTPVVTCLFALLSLPLNVFAQTTDIANEDNGSTITESGQLMTDNAAIPGDFHQPAEVDEPVSTDSVVTAASPERPSEIELADAECRRIGNKLGSVSYQDCKKLDLKWTGSRSVKQAPLLFKEYPPLARRQPLGKILLLGGIHGDEYSSVSIVFKWLNTLEQYHSGLFHWRIVPLLNPDGLLQQNSTRTNANGVDLNRNFPVPDWENTALDYWIKRTYQNPRQYPGPEQLSEPESTWLAEEIKRFQPDVIVSVHAPHGVVDYDGPEDGPHKLGRLYLSLLGTYPGSLGNYAGLQKKIPVVTIELPFAGIMPGPTEISDIWVDLVRWLTNNVQPLPLESVAQEADPS